MAVASDQVLEEEALSEELRSGRQSHTNNVLKKSEAEREETLTALHYPFYEPRAKGGAMTGKRHAVAQILLLQWATAALAMPFQAPGPETG